MEISLKPLSKFRGPLLMKGILPIRVFDFILGRIFGVYKSMDEFKGH